MPVATGCQRLQMAVHRPLPVCAFFDFLSDFFFDFFEEIDPWDPEVRMSRVFAKGAG